MAFCVNCGHQLGDGAKFCDECGTKVSTTNTTQDEQRETAPDRQIHESISSPKTLVPHSGHPQKRIVVFAVIPIIMAILICGIVFFGVSYFNYRAAYKLLDECEYDAAYQAFLDLNGFLDSDEMAMETKYQKACHYLAKQNYRRAIALFGDVMDYKDSEQKINECMYGYVLDNKVDYDTETYNYLCLLKAANYKDSAAIYEDLYAWKVTILWSTGKYDTNYKTSFHKSNSVYCHFTLSGGTPGGKTALYYSGTEPYRVGGSFDGYYEDVVSGQSGWLWWEEGFSTTGNLNVYFYDEDQNVIGYSSVRITG